MRSKNLLAAICAALVVASSFAVGVDAQKRQQRVRGTGSKIQTASVALTEKGYEPTSIKLRRGVPAHVTFTRKVSATCATEVVLPDYGIRRALPLNEAVTVEFTPEKPG